MEDAVERVCQSIERPTQSVKSIEPTASINAAPLHIHRSCVIHRVSTERPISGLKARSASPEHICVVGGGEGEPVATHGRRSLIDGMKENGRGHRGPGPFSCMHDAPESNRLLWLSEWLLGRCSAIAAAVGGRWVAAGDRRAWRGCWGLARCPPGHTAAASVRCLCCVCARARTALPPPATGSRWGGRTHRNHKLARARFGGPRPASTEWMASSCVPPKPSSTASITNRTMMHPPFPLTPNRQEERRAQAGRCEDGASRVVGVVCVCSVWLAGLGGRGHGGEIEEDGAVNGHT